jgi:hypothetical protein
MASKLLWYGDDIKARLGRGIENAMNATMLDCVAQGQQLAPRKTSVLANSLRIERAKKSGGGWVGYWGSFTVGYAIYQEMGTYKMAGKFYLRRSADAIYPTFPGRVGESL